MGTQLSCHLRPEIGSLVCSEPSLRVLQGTVIVYRNSLGMRSYLRPTLNGQDIKCNN